MIKAKMDELGYHASPKRICRLMKEMNLVCTRNRPTLADYKRTCHAQIYYIGNKLNREFSQSKPNCAWVSDITYLRTKEGVYYLCAIIDLFSRKVIGHRLSYTANTELVISTLDNTLKDRQPPLPLIFHSDQGVQYTSAKFIRYLKTHGITHSFSTPGTPYDNAVMELFFGSLKKEELYQHIYNDADELTSAAEEYQINNRSYVATNSNVAPFYFSPNSCETPTMMLLRNDVANLLVALPMYYSVQTGAALT